MNADAAARVAFPDRPLIAVPIEVGYRSIITAKRSRCCSSFRSNLIDFVLLSIEHNRTNATTLILSPITINDRLRLQCRRGRISRVRRAILIDNLHTQSAVIARIKPATLGAITTVAPVSREGLNLITDFDILQIVRNQLILLCIHGNPFVVLREHLPAAAIVTNLSEADTAHGLVVAAVSRLPLSRTRTAISQRRVQHTAAPVVDRAVVVRRIGRRNPCYINTIWRSNSICLRCDVCEVNLISFTFKNFVSAF